jgi:alpha-ribazole phosphatase
VIFYLVRHAQPAGAEGICYGRHEVHVPAGETARAAQALRATIPAAHLDRMPIYSSPLQRCTALAGELARGRAVSETAALLELDFGAWQGRRWSDIPRAELDAWAQDLWSYAPGCGESAQAAAERWRGWVGSLRAQPLEAVIAVTHAGLIRVAHAIESDGDASLLTMAVEYGSAHRLIA